MSFTTEQRAAIEHRDGGYALAANAGSGKTSVLVERFVSAVIDDGIDPGRILAISFTERAAGELRERVRRRLLECDRRDAASEAAGAFIATFHGFCARLLRAHSLLAGLAPEFAVLSEATTVALRELAFERALSGWLGNEETIELAAGFGVEGLRTAIFEAYDELRSRGEVAPRLPQPRARDTGVGTHEKLVVACREAARELAGANATVSVQGALDQLERCTALLSAAEAPGRDAVAALRISGSGAALKTDAFEAYEDARQAYEEQLADALGAAAVSVLDVLLDDFASRYQALKAARGGADFDDLELEALSLLLRHPEVAALWRERFERVMVDELQDTNARQLAMLRLLARDNLFTVGDQFQSIYGFRHADVELFRAHCAEQSTHGRTGVLSANFRSTAAIIDGVNAVFAPLFGSDFTPLRPGAAPPGDAAAEARIDAPRNAGADGAPPRVPVELLITARGGWEQHEAALGSELAPAPLWRRAEARLLAQRIDQLISAGEACAGEIVVLVRAGTAIGVYESAIADLGHVTLASAGGGFYERPEVADLTAYVRALVNPLDDLALFGVLASPLCGADPDQLAGLALAAGERSLRAAQVLGEGSDSEPLRSFAERFFAARQRAASASLAEIVASAVREHGYDLYLCQLHSPARRLANVRKLVRLARDFERREGRDLRRFADALASGRVGALREPEAPPDAAGGGAVRLMTVHTAKGLEFPVVALADLGHGPQSERRRLLVDHDRVGVRLPSEARKWFSTLDFDPLCEERKLRDEAEERRVMYVAMTRAQRRLILSGAANFEQWPERDAQAIDWLGPALVPDLAARAAAAVAPDAGSQDQLVINGELVAGANGGTVRLTLNTAQAFGKVLSSSRGSIDDARFASAAQPRITIATPAPRPAALQLSYTQLAAYEDCGYRYYLERVLRMAPVTAPGAEGGSDEAVLRGVTVHALLEGLDFAAPVAPDGSALARAAAVAGAELADPVAALELADAFARSPLCKRLAAASGVRREAPFSFVMGDDTLISGVFDVSGSEVDGTLLIVDYKTDRLNAGEDLADHVKRKYSLQRLVYTLAGLRAGAPDVEVAYCFLRSPEETVAVRHSAADQPLLERELRERSDPLRAGHFEVTSLPGRTRCGSCPGRARLCSYDEAATLRSDPTA